MIKKISPFRLCVMQNFPYIEQDFDALTDYGLMCKIVEYLNKVIEQQNLTGTKVNELVNWFNNLDVQDEINKKLDEMAESGQLTDIIAQYLQLAGILAYNNVEELKNASNLVNGSFVQTYGYHNYGDGGSAKYKVRNVTNQDTIDDKLIIGLNNPLLIAELLEENLNIKQLGAYGDNIHDDTDVFKYICDVEETTILIPTGSYKISDTINMEVKNKVIGNGNVTIVATNNKNIFNVNRYCEIKNIKFKLPKAYDGNVCEISFKTLSAQPVVNVYNDLNIRIENIDFLFDLDINDIPNKKGNCFLISADETDENIKYNSKGFYGIYLNNIFVKGACDSVIKQYVNKDTQNWITGCYYNNFNIDSAPLYGFFGSKSEDDMLFEKYTDGEEIYFNNWQMQCGNSKNMFYFTKGAKMLYNVMPWDWSYAVSEEYKPFNLLYHADYDQPILLDVGFGTVFDITQITNKPSGINFWNYVSKRFNSNYHNINETIRKKLTPGTFIKALRNVQQNIPANEVTKIEWQNSRMGGGSIFDQFYMVDNSVKINCDTNSILLNVKLALASTGYTNMYIYKNGEIVTQTAWSDNRDNVTFTGVYDCVNGDTFDVRLYCPNTGIIHQYGETLNCLTVTALN